MLNMKSAAALIAAASLASAQNVTVGPVNGNGGGTTVNINLSIDITFTQTFQQVGPTGLIPVEYTFEQHCPGGCPAPNPYAVPYGWAVTTTECNFGPTPTIVTITTCPYANVPPTPPVYGNSCPTCYTDIVRYTPPPTCNTCPPPPCTTVTTVYPPPSTTPCPPTYTAPPPTYTAPPPTYTLPPPVTTSCPPVVPPVVPPPVTSSCPPVVPPPVTSSCPPSSMSTPPPPYTYTSMCPGCPVTTYSMSSKCPTCPATAVTVPPPSKMSTSAYCPGCPKSTSPVPTPVVPPPSIGAGAKLQAGAGLFLAGVVAVFFML